MKVIVKGTMDVEALAKKLIEVAENTISKVEAEHEGVKVNGFEVHEAEVTFKFEVDGITEPQVLTVEHHEGQPELLTWVVDANSDEVATNEDESLYDVWSVAQAQGKEHKFEEITSLYSEAELSYIPDLDESYSDMTKTVYEHSEGFKVVRVKQDGKLIQEYKLVPKA